MTQNIEAHPIQSLIDFSTHNQGELISFGFRLGEKGAEPFQDIHFALHSDMLPLFIAKFQEVGTASDILKSQNPLRTTGGSAGYAYRLVKGAIGPSSKVSGEHILEVETHSQSGAGSKYRLRADRAGLESLCDLIRQYLDGPSSRNQALVQPH